jgi:hypothetical protein
VSKKHTPEFDMHYRLAETRLLAALRELLAVIPAKAPAAGQIVGIEERYAAAVAAAREAVERAK